MTRIQTFKLTGHKGPVTCLANNSHLISTKSSTSKTTSTTSRSNNSSSSTNHHDGNQSSPLKKILLSGSEDGTVRLWDLKANGKRAALCIKCPLQEPSEVTAVSFHSHYFQNASDLKHVHDDATTRCSYPFTIFASWSGKVYAYDIRNISSPIVSYHEDNHDSPSQPSPFYPLPQLQGEEINQLTLYYNHRQHVQYIATADDDGSCRILHPVPLARSTDVNDTQSVKTQQIQHASSNSDPTLVTSITFRPKTKPDQVEFVTSGTDCTICSWDLTFKNKINAKLKSRFHISKLINDENVNQVCNPPIVHSTCWSPSGRLLSAGLGDGSILILKPEGRRLVEVSRIASTRSRLGHSSAVASVVFPQLGGIQHLSSHVTAEDRFMITGGNDGNIIFWDLGSFVGGEYAVDPRLYVNCSDGNETSTVPNRRRNDISSLTLDSDMDQLSLATSSLDPNVLFALNHKEKPNCILSSHASDVAFANSIFVGDTSNDITIYTLPRI